MSLRVLHCPTLVGGLSSQLAKSERALGLDTYSLALQQNYFNYPVDEVIYRSNFLTNQLRRFAWGCFKIAKFDVIHYNFGSSLFPVRVDTQSNLGRYPKWVNQLYNQLIRQWLELADVRLANQRTQVIAVTYQGDDARQGDYCREHYPIHFVNEVSPGYYTDLSDRFKRERIAVFNRYADFIYAVNPDLLNVLPQRARFSPYPHVDMHAWLPVNSDNKIPHVVHAPSHREVKGTHYLLAAIERLQAEGIPLRFTLVEGLSNQEARRIYETADLLVDQLLAGFYGGLAVELMALGKPVICYMRESDMHYLPPAMWRDMPIIQAHPKSIYEVLRQWLTTRKHELSERGMAGRAYVERWHDPLQIAATLKADYENAFNRKQGIV